MKYTEQKIKRCSCCGGKTLHYRNNSKMGTFGWLFSIVLIIFTGGLWLVPMGVWAILSTKFGGWKCDNCMRCGL